MKKTISIIILFLVMSLSGGVFLCAEDFFIDYIEGLIEVKEGSKWIELYEDDIIESVSVIKLHTESMIEFSGKSLTITLIDPGIYNLMDIIAKSKKSNKYGINDIVTAKFAALLEDTGTNKDEGTVMGVRAAGMEEEVDFIGDEIIENIFRTAKQEISRGNFQKGIALMEDAYDWASDENESILLYYIGFCYNKLGKDALALSFLVDIAPDPELPFYAEYVILYGSLLMNSFAHNRALTLFQEYYQSVTPEKSVEYQDISYLTALCYMHLNNPEQTYSYLKISKEIDPGSETGKKAAFLLKDME